MYTQCIDHTNVLDFQVPEQTSWAACEALLLVRAFVLLTQIHLRAVSVLFESTRTHQEQGYLLLSQSCSLSLQGFVMIVMQMA